MMDGDGDAVEQRSAWAAGYVSAWKAQAAEVERLREALQGVLAHAGIPEDEDLSLLQDAWAAAVSALRPRAALTDGAETTCATCGHEKYEDGQSRTHSPHPMLSDDCCGPCMRQLPIGPDGRHSRALAPELPNPWHSFVPTEAPAPAPPEQEVTLPIELRGDGPCGDCGTLDNFVWFTENVLWNRATGENVVHEMPFGAILCVTCFVRRAHDAGLRPQGWRLMADWPWREVPPEPEQPESGGQG